MNAKYSNEYQELLNNSNHLILVLDLIKRIPYWEVIKAYNLISAHHITHHIDDSWSITRQNSSIKINDKKSYYECKKELCCYVYDSFIDIYIGRFYCVEMSQFIDLYNLAHNPELMNFI